MELGQFLYAARLLCRQCNVYVTHDSVLHCRVGSAVIVGSAIKNHAVESNPVLAWLCIAVALLCCRCTCQHLGSRRGWGMCVWGGGDHTVTV
jgi:hypothetical protein